MLLGGPGLAFGVAGASHLLFAFVLAFIRPHTSIKRLQARPTLLGGVHYLLEDRRAGALMLAVAALGVGADAAITLGPPMAEALGGGEELVGLLGAFFGGGAFLFFVLFGQLRRRRTLREIGTLGYLVLGVGLTTTGLARSPAIALAGMLMAGTGFMMGAVTINARIQKRVPDHLRGRVMALWVVVFAGSRPIAAIINGSIAEFLSITVALLVGALMAWVALPLVRVSYKADATEITDSGLGSGPSLSP